LALAILGQAHVGKAVFAAQLGHVVIDDDLAKELNLLLRHEVG